MKSVIVSLFMNHYRWDSTAAECYSNTHAVDKASGNKWSIDAFLCVIESQYSQRKTWKIYITSNKN